MPSRRHEFLATAMLVAFHGAESIRLAKGKTPALIELVGSEDKQEIVMKGGETETLAAKTWESSATGDDDWQPVNVVTKYGGAPWGDFIVTGHALAPQAAGVPGVVRVIYLAEPTPVRVRHLERDVEWVAEHFDPVSGETTTLAMPRIDSDGACRFDPPAGAADWVLVLRRR